MSNVLNQEYHVRRGTILNRPSKVIKTPYVADVQTIDSYIDDECLAHTPSLGCNGMVEKNALVFMVEKDSRSKAKCRYTVIASELTEKGQRYVVGVDPTLGEKLGQDILTQGVIVGFRAKSLDKQFTYEDCRFDFKGITTSNEPFICEVKNVSIAVYENIRPSQMKKQDYSAREYDSKIAIFPSGFKPKGKTHSERAVKQTKRLTEIKKKHPEVRCLILYVIQRDDIASFQISRGDKIYFDTIKEAVSSNVEVAAVSVRWMLDEERNTLTPQVHNKLKVSMDDNI